MTISNTPKDSNPSYNFFVWTRHIRLAATLTATGLSVALAIAFHANADGVCWPSIKTISKNSRLCERTVKTQIKILAEQGWIIIYKMPGHNKANHYRLTYPQKGVILALAKARGDKYPPTGASDAPIPVHPLPTNSSRDFPLNNQPSLVGEGEQMASREEAIEHFAFIREQLSNKMRA